MRHLVFSVVVALAITIGAAAPASHAAIDFTTATLQFDVIDIIDQSISVGADPLSIPQTTFPRDSRGLAITPDATGAVRGFNTTGTTSDPSGYVSDGGQIREIDIFSSGGATGTDKVTNLLRSVPTVSGTHNVRGKGIEVDDLGRRWYHEFDRIFVGDPGNLSGAPLLDLTITGAKVEGGEFYRAPGLSKYYAVDRANQNVRGFNVLDIAGSGTVATPLLLTNFGFGTAGTAAVAGAMSPRNAAVHRPNAFSVGNVWVTDPTAGSVFVLNPNTGALLSTIAVPGAFDVAILDDDVLVTTGTNRTIVRIDANNPAGGVLQTIDPITPLGAGGTQVLDDDGQSGGGALAGIDVDPLNGDFVLVSFEAGQTFGEQSVFGGGDTLFDDNEILLGIHTGALTAAALDESVLANFESISESIAAANPEPATIALLGIGATTLIRRRRR